MKRFIAIIFLLFSVSSITVAHMANVSNSSTLVPNKENFLDSLFYSGTIRYNDNTTQTEFLNYDIKTNKIYILRADGSKHPLSDLSKVQSIKYNRRHFVPINSHRVAEVVKTFKNGDILLCERKTIEKPKDNGPYGVNPKHSGVKDYSKVKSKNKYIKQFYLRTENSLFSLSSEKNIKKLFPSKIDTLKVEFKRKVENESQEAKYIRIISACINDDSFIEPTSPSTSMQQYLDSVFCRGSIKFTNNIIAKEYLNYNLITNRILIMYRDGSISPLRDLSKIQSVEYSGRCFLPISPIEVAEVIKVFSNGYLLLCERKTTEIDEPSTKYSISEQFYLRIAGVDNPISCSDDILNLFPSKADTVKSLLEQLDENETEVARYIKIISVCL